MPPAVTPAVLLTMLDSVIDVPPPMLTPPPASAAWLPLMTVPAPIVMLLSTLLPPPLAGVVVWPVIWVLASIEKAAAGWTPAIAPPQAAELPLNVPPWIVVR